MDVSESLPGDEIIRTGLEDLAQGVDSIAALLVSIGAHRLRRLGMDIPNAIPAPENRLYALLEKGGADSAHSGLPVSSTQPSAFEGRQECSTLWSSSPRFWRGRRRPRIVIN